MRVTLYEYASVIGVKEYWHCDTCGRRYSHKAGLYQHQKYECGKEPQFSCLACPYRARLKCNLDKHIAMKHGRLLKPVIKN